MMLSVTSWRKSLGFGVGCSLFSGIAYSFSSNWSPRSASDSSVSNPEPSRSSPPRLSRSSETLDCDLDSLCMFAPREGNASHVPGSAEIHFGHCTTTARVMCGVVQDTVTLGKQLVDSGPASRPNHPRLGIDPYPGVLVLISAGTPCSSEAVRR